jgi:translation initiation factor IF-2
MNTTTPKTVTGTKIPRPPVVVVMGHIDHGKSTLLDYIRKTSVVEKEAGGITQHLGAYEVVLPQTNADAETTTGVDNQRKSAPSLSEYQRAVRKVTFLDTPGHEAFKGIRGRGAAVADIGILVVSAEEGVKPQTVEALADIKKAGIPYIVAATKIDKPTANIERVKQSLAEHEVYVEGYGGDVPFAAISGKTGDGVDDLLDLILLVAELHNVSAVPGAPLSAYVIESNVDSKKGVFATLLIKEGTLKKGEILVAGDAFTPTRRIENFLGESIEKAEGGMPVSVAGWSSLPRVGGLCAVAKNKREAEALIANEKSKKARRPTNTATTQITDAALLPLIIKADTGSSLEAVEAEIRKQATNKITIKILSRGVGPISESDIKLALLDNQPVIVGFNVGIDAPAKGVVERGGISVQTFTVIYKLVEWVAELVKERTPKVTVVVVKAGAKILKIFSTEKDRQVLGGKVLQGKLGVGDEFNILRRGTNIGHGKIRELQKFKEKVSSASEGSEFGAFVSTSIEIMQGDAIEAITTVEQ